MKRLKLLLFSVFILNIAFAQELDSFLDDANSFFIKNVSDGKVNYEGLKENIELKGLIRTIETLQFTELNDTEQKAYLINVYNLLVIHQISESWPISSPMDITGFFDGLKHKIAGNNWALNYLENNIIRPSFKDPRLHFVLVCGALDCPPIINEAYYPSTLEVQLEEQTKLALNNPNFIKTNQEPIQISEIFKWYNEDFKLKAKNEIEYINNYRIDKIDPKTKYTYYDYDWSVNSSSPLIFSELEKPTEFNLQTYNAGSLLKKNKFDVSLFNSIYTQTKSHWLGVTSDGFRETFYSSLLQFTYGTSKNARVNLGLDVKLGASGKSTSDSFSKISRAFEFKNNDSTRVGMSSIGPRIKIQPFKNESNFTIQSSLLFPTVKAPEGRSADAEGNGALYFLEWDKVQWWTQFYYVKNFKRSQLFLEADVWARLAYYENKASAIDLPVTVIYSYFPTSKTTFYGIASHLTRTQYNPNNYNDDITTAANYTSAGLGFKYQLTSKLNLELLYTNFLRGVNSGLGITFNLGLRYVH